MKSNYFYIFIIIISKRILQLQPWFQKGANSLTSNFHCKETTALHKNARLFNSSVKKD